MQQSLRFRWSVLFPFFALIALTGCGDAKPGQGGASDGGTSSATVEEQLEITVDGARIETNNKVQTGFVSVSKDRFHVHFSAKMTSPEKEGEDLSIVVAGMANGPADLTLIREYANLGREGAKNANIKIFESSKKLYKEGKKFAEILSRSGTVTIDTLEIVDVKGSPRIAQIAGTFEGVFRAKGSKEDQKISGRFGYARR